MSPLSDDTIRHLTAYLLGEGTPEERLAVERWIAGAPDRRHIVTRLRATFAPEEPARIPGWDADATWTGVLKRRSRPSARRALPNWAAVMAVAAVIVCGIALVNRVVGRRSPDVRTFQTAAGQQANIVLANSVRVVLGPTTVLAVTMPSHDGGTNVTMSGEALFTVPHSHRVPFVVRTRNAVTKVLGTTFLVRQYDNDRMAGVVVADGRVSLRGVRGTTAENDAVLHIGALGTVDDSGHVRVTPAVAIEDYTAWTRGQLVFHNTPVRDIVTELGRAYGVDIRLNDSTLATRALTWSVPTTEKSLSGTLNALATVLGAHVARLGKTLMILPGAAAPPRPFDFSKSSTSERGYGR